MGWQLHRRLQELEVPPNFQLVADSICTIAHVCEERRGKMAALSKSVARRKKPLTHLSWLRPTAWYARYEALIISGNYGAPLFSFTCTRRTFTFDVHI